MNKIKKLFSEELAVINIGVKGFQESLDKQNIKTLHVDWKPSASGDKRVLDILSKIM